MESTPSAAYAPTIRDYELIRRIGEGSYGEVWLARGITGLYRAVKIVWRQEEGDRAFDREFRGIQRFAELSLTEPRQLAVLHVGRSDTGRFFFYVMELADDVESGREFDPANYTPLTLRELCRRAGRLKPQEVIRIGVALAEALSSLHANKLVHRDIKPSNVIIVGGVPKLADVGLVTGANRAETFVGTEGYYPPEGPGQPAADVYGFGKLLYELATGNDRSEYPVLPDDLDVDEERATFIELNEIINRACEPNWQKRYQNGGEVLEHLLLLQARKSVRRLRRFEQLLTLAKRMAIVAGAALLGSTLFAVWNHNRTRALQEAAYPSYINLANLALRGGNLAAARNFLAASTNLGPNRPGFEWYALNRETAGDTRYVHALDTNAVEQLRFAPSGGKLLGRSRNGRLKVWAWPAGDVAEEIASDAEFASWGSGPEALWLKRRNPEFAPIGTNAGTAIKVEIQNPPIFLSDGRLLNASRSQQRISVLETTGEKAGAVARELALGEAISPGELFTRMSSDAAGETVATLHFQGLNHNASCRVSVWSMPEKRLVWTRPNLSIVHDLRVSPGGLRVAVATTDSTNLTIFSSRTGEPIWGVGANAGQLLTLEFSPDEQFLATAGDDQKVRIWDLNKRELHTELTGAAGSIRALAWSPDGLRIAAGTSQGEVSVWPLNANKIAPDRPVREAGELKRGDGGGMLLSEDSAWVAASGNDESVHVFAVTNLTERRVITGAFNPLLFGESAEGTENNMSLISLDRNARMVISSLATLETTVFGPRVLASTNETVVISSMAVSRNGLLFLCATDGEQALWNIRERKRVWSAPLERRGVRYPGFVAISANGERMICGYRNDGTVQVRGAAGAALLKEWKHPDRIYASIVGPDGSWCAVADDAGKVVAYKMDGTVLNTMSITGSPSSLAIGGDGDRLVCGTTMGTVQFFALKGWKPLTLFVAADSAEQTGDLVVRNLEFSRDRSWLAARTSAGTLRLWRGR